MRTREKIKEYPSLAEAAIEHNTKYTSILSVCAGRRLHVLGKAFVYKEDYAMMNQTEEKVDINKENIMAIEQEQAECIICGVKSKNLKGLATHIQFSHKMNSEEYTVQHLFGGNRPSCAVKDCPCYVRYTTFSFKKYCKDHSYFAESEGGKVGGKYPKKDTTNIIEDNNLAIITSIENNNSDSIETSDIDVANDLCILTEPTIIVPTIPTVISMNTITADLSEELYGDSKNLLIWNGNKLSNKFLAKQDLETRKAIVEDCFNWFRTHGFPYPKHSERDLIKDWDHLKRENINAGEGNTLPNKQRSGMDVVQQFSGKQFYETKAIKEPSMFEAFNNDKTLRAVLENRIVRYGEFFNINGAMLRQGFRSTRSSAVVSNFNCVLAKYFYENYSKENDYVYDYSMGFGHRLLSSLAAKRHYIACDPWVANIESCKKMYEFIKKIDPEVSKTSIELNPVGSETFCPDEYNKKFSLAFSSPPYFTKEIYDNNSNGQSANGIGYNEWINVWWKTVVVNISKMLKDDGYFVLNMFTSLDKKHDILKDMLNVCEEYGFKTVKTYFLKMSQSHFSKFAKTPDERVNFLHKQEPIVVMRRI